MTPDCPIAMDGRMLVHSRPTGVGTYAQGLRRALARIVAHPLIVSDRETLDRAAAAPGGRGRRWLRALFPFPRRTIERADGDDRLLLAPDIFRLAQIYFDVYGRLLRLRVPGPRGIVHWTYPVPLMIHGWANLYTVHDLIPLLHPELSPIDPRRHRRLLDRIAKAASALVTVSDASAADIAATLGYPASRIHNCGQVAEPERSSAPLPGQLNPGGYLLAIGSVERRKNIDALAQAYRQSGAAMPLVIAGPDGWDATTVNIDGVIRLFYLPDSQIRALLGNARAVLMPSLAEGFGLPVIEAMALGCPVMTSAGGALEEVAGGAALLVDPQDVAAMARAIARLSTDDGLCARLAAAGRRNAERFTLERFVEKLTVLYAGIAARSTAG